MLKSTATAIDSFLTRRVEKIYPSQASLKKRLLGNQSLRVYQGFDPTGAKLHLGHTIGLRNLQSCLELGHEVIILFGTGTVLVGDPSQRDTGRKLISTDEIEANIKTWKQQVGKIIDLERASIKENGDWLLKLGFKDIVTIASQISAIQLFKRESFTRRINRGDTVWYHETLYPLLQGYDSVAMDVDIEFGGSDQTFNMLIGRELQKKMNHKEKFVITNPMILGTDGGQMSKTTGNCIWLDDSADEIYGKTMSIADSQIQSYHQLLTDLPLISDAQIQANPLSAKKAVAFDLVRQFHGLVAANKAEKQFESTIQAGAVPPNIPLLNIEAKSIILLDLLKQALPQTSASKLKQVIIQGGVQYNQVRLSNPQSKISPKAGDILKFGKRQYFRIK